VQICFKKSFDILFLMADSAVNFLAEKNQFRARLFAIVPRETAIPLRRFVMKAVCFVQEIVVAEAFRRNVGHQLH